MIQVNSKDDPIILGDKRSFEKGIEEHYIKASTRKLTWTENNLSYLHES